MLRLGQHVAGWHRVHEVVGKNARQGFGIARTREPLLLDCQERGPIVFAAARGGGRGPDESHGEKGS